MGGNGECRIRTYEGECQQIYSLPPLAARETPRNVGESYHSPFDSVKALPAICRIRTDDPEITNHVL